MITTWSFNFLGAVKGLTAPLPPPHPTLETLARSHDAHGRIVRSCLLSEDTEKAATAHAIGDPVHDSKAERLLIVPRNVVIACLTKPVFAL
jgi:hypothetical protein